MISCTSSIIFFILVISLLLIIIIILLAKNSRIKTIDNQWVNTRKEYPMGTILTKNLPNSTLIYLKGLLSSGDIKLIENLPEYYDLRKKYEEKITIPLDQADCGSCWAFATCSALSDRIAITENPLFWDRIHKGSYITYFYGKKSIKIGGYLSPYFLAACDYCEDAKKNADLYKIFIDGNFCNEKCGGGLIEYAMIFANKVGLISMTCNTEEFSYTCNSLELIKKGIQKGPKGNPCPIMYFDTPYRIDIGKNLQENEKLIMSEIITNGTVVTGIEIYDNFTEFDFKPSSTNESFKNFDSKYVYKTIKGSLVGGHAICIIGWGTCTDGTKYWICKNSWSVDWGDGGYFRVLRGVNFINIEEGLFICKVNWNLVNKQFCTYPNNSFSDQEYPEVFGCSKPK